MAQTGLAIGDIDAFDDFPIGGGEAATELHPTGTPPLAAIDCRRGHYRGSMIAIYLSARAYLDRTKPRKVASEARRLPYARAQRCRAPHWAGAAKRAFTSAAASVGISYDVVTTRHGNIVPPYGYRGSTYAWKTRMPSSRVSLLF